MKPLDRAGVKLMRVHVCKSILHTSGHIIGVLC